MIPLFKTVYDPQFLNIFRYSLHSALKYKWSLFITIFFISISVLVEVIVPLYAGYLIDAISMTNAATRSPKNIIYIFVIFTLLGLLGVLFRLVSYLSIVEFGSKACRDSYTNCFTELQSFDSAWFMAKQTGSNVRIITRGVQGLDQLYDTMLISILPATLTFLGVAFTISTKWLTVGIVVLIFSFLYIYATMKITVRWVSPAISQATDFDTHINGELLDTLSCNPIVKAFTNEDFESKRIGYISEAWRKAYRVAGHRNTVNVNGQNFLLILLRSMIIGAVIVFWYKDKATAGDVAFVLSSFFMLQGYLRDAGTYIGNLQTALVDMQDMVTILTENTSTKENISNESSLIDKDTAIDIQFNNVCFTYPSEHHPILQAVTCRFQPGQRTAIVGSSGAGKTTIIKLLIHLYKATSGEIVINGYNIDKLPLRNIREIMSLVPQEPILFHRTIEENIGYGNTKSSLEEIIQAAKLANAHDFISALPNGYKTMVGDRGMKLSGGERQRIAIARAFLKDSPVLILDEATSSLDNASETTIKDAIGNLARGRTTIAISHRLVSIIDYDQILVMDNGEIIEAGNHVALMNIPNGFYRKLFNANN